MLALRFTKFLMSILELRVSFSSNFASLFKCHETQLFCTFSCKSLFALDKRSSSISKFPISRQLAWKLSKFFKSFFKLQVSFPLNFVPPFSVMTHTFCEIFLLKYYMLLTKRAHQCTIFQSYESSLNSSYHFWNHKVRVYSNFASLFSVMNDISSVFFLALSSVFF